MMRFLNDGGLGAGQACVVAVNEPNPCEECPYM